jgi:hypothetical protein
LLFPCNISALRADMRKVIAHTLTMFVGLRKRFTIVRFFINASTHDMKLVTHHCA